MAAATGSRSLIAGIRWKRPQPRRRHLETIHQDKLLAMSMRDHESHLPGEVIDAGACAQGATTDDTIHSLRADGHQAHKQGADATTTHSLRCGVRVCINGAKLR
jgi:hypothetical protein